MPVIATASEEYGSEPASNAIDGNTATHWTTLGSMAAWLMLDYGVAIAKGDYTVYPRSDAFSYRNPTTWTWEAANNLASIIGTASSYYDATTPPSNAFDISKTTRWMASGTPMPCWIRGQSSTAFVCTSAILQGSPETTTRNAKDFLIQGSLDGSTWVTLSTQVGVTWAVNEVKTFTFSNTTAYLYYQIYVTANTGENYVSFCDINFVNTVNPWVVLDTKSGFVWTLNQYHTFACSNSVAYRYYRMNITLNQNGSGYTSLAELSTSVSATAQGALRRPTIMSRVSVQQASRW